MERVVAKLSPLAETDEQKDLLSQELRRYQAGYINRLHAYLQSRTRVMSPMITGPARFPVDRNRKAAREADRRGDEISDWSAAALDAIRKSLIKTRTPEQASDAEFRRLKRRIDGNIATLLQIQNGSPFNAQAFKDSIAGAIKRSADAGNIEAARRATEYLRDAQKVLGRPAFTDRHGVWKYAED